MRCLWGFSLGSSESAAFRLSEPVSVRTLGSRLNTEAEADQVVTFGGKIDLLLRTLAEN